MFSRLEICYKTKWILEAVMHESDRLHSSITDPTKFEERCIRRVARYLEKNKENKTHRRYIFKIIKQEAKTAVNLYSKENYRTFSDLTYSNEDGEEIEFETIDILANVESELVAKEMTALLGKDGRRKEILEAWSIGNTNDKLISNALGRTLGGNVESHRKFIQRFRNECREQLSTAI